MGTFQGVGLQDSRLLPCQPIHDIDGQLSVVKLPAVHVHKQIGIADDDHPAGAIFCGGHPNRRADGFSGFRLAVAVIYPRVRVSCPKGPGGPLKGKGTSPIVHHQVHVGGEGAWFGPSVDEEVEGADRAAVVPIGQDIGVNGNAKFLADRVKDRAPSEGIGQEQEPTAVGDEGFQGGDFFRCKGLGWEGEDADVVLGKQ